MNSHVYVRVKKTECDESTMKIQHFKPKGIARFQAYFLTTDL